MIYSNSIINKKINIDDLPDLNSKNFVTNINKNSLDKIAKDLGNLNRQDPKLLNLYSIKYIVDNWSEEESIQKLKKLLMEKFYSLHDTEKDHEKSFDKIDDTHQKILFLSYFAETEDTEKLKKLISKLDGNLIRQIPLSDRITLISKMSADREDVNNNLLKLFGLTFEIKYLQDRQQRIHCLRQLFTESKEVICSQLMKNITEKPNKWGLENYDLRIIKELDKKIDKLPIDKIPVDKQQQLLNDLIDKEAGSFAIENKNVKEILQAMPKDVRLALTKQLLLEKGVGDQISFLNNIEFFKIGEFSPGERFELAKKIITHSEKNTKNFLSKIDKFQLENMTAKQNLELANLISNQGEEIIEALRGKLKAFKPEIRAQIEQKIDPKQIENFFENLYVEPRLLSIKGKINVGKKSTQKEASYRLKLPLELKKGSPDATDEDRMYLKSLTSLFANLAKTKADVAEALFDEVKKKQIRIKNDSELKLVFGTRVHHDGSGDYFNELELIKGIREVYPNSNVRMFYTYSRLLPNVDYKEYNLDDDEVIGFRKLIRETSEFSTRREFDTMMYIQDYVLEKDHLSIMKLTTEGVKFCRVTPEEHLKLLKENPATTTHLDRALDLAEFIAEADIAFDVSIPERIMSDFIQASGADYYSYREYGAGAMGPDLGAAGIHRIKPDTSGEFGDKKVTEIFETCGEHKPYFVYMRTPHRFIEYVIAQDYWKGEKEVNIIALAGIGDTTLLVEDLKSKNIPISKMILVDSDLNESVTVGDQVEKNGMVVRIFQGKKMQHSDFMKAMDRSASIVGCTGDVSFSEAISLNKVPFYETIKTSVLSGLKNIAEELKLEDLVAFLNSVPKGEDLRRPDQRGVQNHHIPKFLNDYTIEKADFDLTKAQEQMIKLKDFYYKYHSINDVAIRDINQNYLMKKHDLVLECIEADLVKSFGKGKITAKELHESYLEKLKRFEDLEIREMEASDPVIFPFLKLVGWSSEYLLKIFKVLFHAIRQNKL